MDILFDRCVNFIVDEVEETIEERGGEPQDQGAVSSVYKALPACTMSAMEAAAITHHEAEVETPALAILCERKKQASSRSSSSSAWRKEPVTLARADAVYYRKLVEGVDPVLPQQLAAAPAVNSLTLRVSWSPRHCSAIGSIESSHENLLALSLGDGYCERYSQWRQPAGCYLVLDTRAKSVAVVPPVPAAVSGHSQGRIGTRVAVLRTNNAQGGYLLAELFRHTTDTDQGGSLSTNKGTLFTWRSPGSSPSPSPSGAPRAAANQWTWKEVVLPLPDPDEDDGYCFKFDAEAVFAVSSTSLCWVDVWAGFLVSNNITSSSEDLVFTFIPLPEGCAPRYVGSSTDRRSVCCVDSETIKLLCMDDGGGEVTVAITTWTLKFPLTDNWRWEEDEDASCSSLCVPDLLDEAIPVDGGGGKHRLLRRLLRWPIIGRAQPGLAHVSVVDIEFNRKRNEWEGRGVHQVTLDVPRRRVASVFTFPEGSSSAGHMLLIDGTL